MKLRRQHKILLLNTIVMFLVNTSLLLAEVTEVKSFANIISVNDINSESNENLSIISIMLSDIPPWKRIPIKDHTSFIQIKLNNTIAADPGKFYEGNSPYIDKIAVFQSSKNETLIRFFLSKNHPSIYSSMEAEVLNKRIVITLDHQSISKSTKLLANGKNNKADNEKKSEVSVYTSKDDNFLNLLLKGLAAFVFVIFLIILTTLTIRRIIRNNRILSQGKNSIQLETLNSLILSSKQKLSVVQVGSQQILLSISADKVSMLTELNKPNVETNLPLYKTPLINKNHRIEEKKSAPEIENPRATKGKKITTKPKKNIEYAIDDSGVKDMIKTNEGVANENNQSKAIEDVTKLIREKLKKLDKIN